MRKRLINFSIISFLSLIMSCEKSENIGITDPFKLPNSELKNISINIGGSITKIKSDNDDNVWISSDGNGIICYNNVETKYYNSSTVGVMNDRVRDFDIDLISNIIYIGTVSEGLIIYEDNIWTILNKSNSELPSNYISALTLDSEGNLWIATSSSLAKFNGTNLTVFNEAEINYPSSQILTMEFFNDILWIGSSDGLVQFDGTECKKIDKTAENSSFRNIFSIDTDSKGNVWLGSPSGLGIVSDSIIIKQNIPDEVLVTHNIFSICIDKEDNIWCATNSSSFDGGLIKYNYVDNEWKFLKSPSKVAYECYNISTVFVDNYNNKWIDLGIYGLSVYNENGINY